MRLNSRQMQLHMLSFMTAIKMMISVKVVADEAATKLWHACQSAIAQNTFGLGNVARPM